jgi:hypothetical protein
MVSRLQVEDERRTGELMNEIKMAPQVVIK